MNIYLENGYLNMRKIININVPFIFVVGARAVGKTYGSLQVVTEDNTKFMYTRRIQTQTDLINKTEFCPFKELNVDFGWNIWTSPLGKYSSGFYRFTEIDGVNKPSGAPIGYTSALSTMANMRGFSASDIPVWLYDEFIPEKHERPIKHEGAAFLNAYETMSRNRELKGKPALKCVAMSNSNDLANAIFMELQLVRKANEMKRKKQEICILEERGICIINVENSPISKQKEKTALYKASGVDSRFARMALKNEFSGEEIGKIVSRPLTEYKPVVAVGEIVIYEHKAKKCFYVSTHKTGAPHEFGNGDTERGRFKRCYGWLWDEYMDNNIEFEEYLCEILLTKTFK